MVADDRLRRRARCPRCRSRLRGREDCQACGYSRRRSADDWIRILCDRDSFRALGLPYSADPLEFVADVRYADAHAATRLETCVDESVVAGMASIDGREIVVAVFDFRFFGGSLGVASGEKLVEALSTAASERLPFVLLVSSSGARVQEGLPALFQMARTSAAVLDLRDANVPFVALLADPTTGSAYASCANLADYVAAEEGALVAFAGPRVVRALAGRRTAGPRAESLAEGGIVDGVFDRRHARELVAQLLDVLRAPRGAEPVERVVLGPPRPVSKRWTLVESVRRHDSPTAVDWLDRLADRSVELRGDRSGFDDPVMRCAFAAIGRTTFLVLAQDRSALDGAISAAGYRKALRALEIAGRLRLPVLSIVDGAGATVGPEADASGIGHWVARSFAAVLESPTPVICLVVGQGSSGGALALSVGDRIYMLERSTFSVISPEGAAAILPGVDRSPADWADSLRLAASDAFTLGLVDGVVPQTGGRRSGRAVVRQLRNLLAADARELSAVDPSSLTRARRGRYLASTRHLLRPLPESSVGDSAKLTSLPLMSANG
jgi:acyl-CoA carboxylase subunit beta